MPPDDPSDHGSIPPTDPRDPAADPGEQTEDQRPPERTADPAPADWRTSTYSRSEPRGGSHRAPERGPEERPSDTAERTPPEGPPLVRGRHLAWVRLETPPDDAVTTRLPTGHPETIPPADTHPISPPSPPEAPPTPPDPPKVEEPAPAKRPVETRPSPTSETAPAGLRDGPGVPSALGRLVAIVVTCGLAWALAVAVGVWLFVFLVSRSG